MKIVVTEAPKSAWDCPFVGENRDGFLISPMCTIGGVHECTHTRWGDGEELKKPICDSLFVLEK